MTKKEKEWNMDQISKLCLDKPKWNIVYSIFFIKQYIPMYK